ncbi:hypothetical protein SCLCIDRAFT_1213649 [Scleroderma citrinum Foug A]|uniref:Uncharacterized protein n=1 Tax=Scleroderma citrinum Foug A TaxID=1036808 RepID=A0A0C3AG09_9AGAM|nr:hypothetical protein SCLCIDRAFT_1213649 [Scleroderma citrinum Foug A]
MSSDPRFARLKSDPRFRRPKKRQSRAVDDSRFQAGPSSDEGKEKAWGKPISSIADYARGIVLMESSDEEEDEEELDVCDEAEALHLEEDEGDKHDAQKTRRLAVVNMDWDHIRAIHLFKIFSSLVSSTASVNSQSTTKVVRGNILSVRVYPSEFGKQRMEREEQHGPPPEVFKKKKKKEREDEDVIDEKTIHEIGSGEDYDEDALRTYQLERLRYYYAIVECDTVETAAHIFDELEGAELERSANVFDLSFVPDDMTFEGEPRDEATELPNGTYQAVEFSTDALRHSKVKLTWDEEDPDRTNFTRRALTKKEMEEADFKAYIASSESSSESGEEDDHVHQSSKRNTDRDRLRALLLGGNDNALPEGWGGIDAEEPGSDVDMQITFTPGISVAKDPEDETTLERYQQKMREKRRRKKEERLEAAVAPEEGEDDRQTEAVGKRKHKKKRNDRKQDEYGSDEAQDDDFVMDVKDDRFKALHEDYQFAIDPSNPHFKKTKGMASLLEERSKRQKDRPRLTSHDLQARGPSIGDDGRSLHSLAERVKRKSAVSREGGMGKRRKL